MIVPKLLPVMPSKDLRLTFKPTELVALYILLEQSAEFFDKKAAKQPSPELKQLSDALWHLEAKVSYKLSFRPVV